MLCPCCDNDMEIVEVRHAVEGDNQPQTATLVYQVPYFKCRSPACFYFGQLIEGEKIPVYSGMERKASAAGGVIECCGKSLCVYTETAFSMSDAIYATAHMHEDGRIDITCSDCNRVWQVPQGKRTRIVKK